MQAGVNPLNSKIFFKKLRKPLDDRFLLFRAVAAAKAGDGRQDLVNIRAGRFERAVAERIGNKAACASAGFSFSSAMICSSSCCFCCCT